MDRVKRGVFPVLLAAGVVIAAAGFAVWMIGPGSDAEIPGPAEPGTVASGGRSNRVHDRGADLLPEYTPTIGSRNGLTPVPGEIGEGTAETASEAAAADIGTGTETATGISPGASGEVVGGDATGTGPVADAGTAPGDGSTGQVGEATGEGTGGEPEATPQASGAPTPTPARDTGDVRGRTLGRITGKPVPGLNIICTGGSGPVGTVVSDRQGEFFLSDLQPDTYSLEVLDHASAAEVQVVAGDTANVVLTIDDQGSISGRVVSSRGEPVSGAAVRLLRGASGSFLGETLEDSETSGGDGSFFFLSAPVGVSIKLEAEAQGYTPAVKGPFVLQNDIPLEGVELVLAAASAIAGRVINPEGAPLAAARVEARVMGAWGRGQGEIVSTEADGTYEIRNLSPGEWEVEASATGYSREKKRCTISEADETVSLDFTLSPGDVISGRVLDSNGGSVSGAVVRLVGGLASLETESGFDGGFEFDSVDEGTYNIAAERSGYTPAWKSVRVGSGEEPVLVLGELATLSVRVTAEGDMPVETYQLVLKRRGFPEGLLSSPRETRVDVSSPNGIYSEKIPAGAYQLMVSAEGYQKMFRDIKLEAGSMPPIIDIRLKGGMMVQGVVTSTDGDRPVAGAHVSWYLGNVPEANTRFFIPDPNFLSTPLGTAVTDPSGVFVLDGLPPSYMTLLCRATGFAPEVVGGVNPLYQQGNIEIRMDPAVRVYGEVRYLGNPFSSADVEMEPVDSLREVPPEWKTQTDFRGDFEFDSVSPGTYRILVTRDYNGSRLSRGFVAEVPAQDTSFLLELPGGEFSAFVVDASTGLQLREGPVRFKPVSIQDQVGNFILEIPPVLTLKYPDGSGAFTFVALPAGEYLLEVAVPGYLTTERTVSVSGEGRISEQFIVVRDTAPAP
jgi:hypothetical protein